METRLFEYNGIAIRVPRGISTKEFLDDKGYGMTYHWFQEAVNNAVESAEEGNLQKLIIMLSRIETLGKYYQLRGTDRFIMHCAGQAVGVCVRRNINPDLLKEFGDKYKLFVLGSRD